MLNSNITIFKLVKIIVMIKESYFCANFALDLGNFYLSLDIEGLEIDTNTKISHNAG